MAESFNNLFEDEENKIPVTPPPPSDNSTSQSHHSELQNINHDFIFCSECGQKIKSDSKFCRYCGAKVDEEDLSTHSSTSQNIDDNKVRTSSESIIEHKISSAKPIEVKIKSDPSVKKSTIADEIVANLKMIGFALIIWIVYIVGFVCYRSKDAAPLTETNSYYGESCYDPGVLSGSWEFSWEKHLATKISYISTKKNKFGISEFNPMSASDYLYLSNLTPNQALEEANRQAKSKNISDEHFAQLTQAAKEEAKRDRDSFNDKISSIRKYAYEDELHSHMLWAAIISLSIMIIGRYFILACKWVSRNKSE